MWRHGILEVQRACRRTCARVGIEKEDGGAEGCKLVGDVGV
jgi:hypothetical protein